MICLTGSYVTKTLRISDNSKIEAADIAKMRLPSDTLPRAVVDQTNATLNATTLCPITGSTVVAVEHLITFFLTNIIAHVATIYLKPGSNKTASLSAVFSALVTPVSAGDRAFRALKYWLERCVKYGTWWRLGGDSFEDACMAGAVAIFIPLKFAPLVAGRWRKVEDFQHVLLQDHARYMEPGSRGLGYTSRRHPPDRVKRYYMYILPATSEFPGYSHFKIYPSSNVMRQFIALMQIGFAIYSLFIHFSGSIQKSGLSSPFLIVLPYLIMSVVNLICSFLVNSYPHVAALVMDKTKLPEFNEGIILEKANTFSSLKPSKCYPPSFISPELSTKITAPAQGNVVRRALFLTLQQSAFGFTTQSYVSNKGNVAWHNHQSFAYLNPVPSSINESPRPEVSRQEEITSSLREAESSSPLPDRNSYSEGASFPSRDQEEIMVRNSRVKPNKGKGKEIDQRNVDESKRFDFYADWPEDLKRFQNESIVDDSAPSGSSSKPFVKDRPWGRPSMDAQLGNQTGGEHCNLAVT